ncbi:MAG: hypothetical protein Q8K19_09695 [Methylicorpusculum sp.]|uniref:hypothetical protein n=1 Tax=Methylicorpusculum sp. TaxID=2713644 RepID=UPI00272F78C4|nr:hypothetical protein [Methylicorpusculum sp.]MDP2178765.1 hypothetical protein [Methylicorpusculum sp.]
MDSPLGNPQMGWMTLVLCIDWRFAIAKPPYTIPFYGHCGSPFRRPDDGSNCRVDSPLGNPQMGWMGLLLCIDWRFAIAKPPYANPFYGHCGSPFKRPDDGSIVGWVRR